MKVNVHSSTWWCLKVGTS